jgi:dihydrofolate reductase
MVSTGAVLAGRGTIEPAGGWGGDHHRGVPIFILSRHRPPAEAADWPLVAYVDDLAVAVTRSKEAAGERNVLVHGAGIAQRALAAGLLDEIQIHLVPVLFGQGRRLFDHLAAGQVELEPLAVIEAPGVTHLRYRVLR